MNKQVPQRAAGYILLLTLMIISVSVILVSTIVNRSLGYQRLSVLVQDREKAKMIALGGIELAIGQITLNPESKSEAQESGTKNNAEKRTQDNKRKQAWMTNLLTILNSWQTFDFKEQLDGVDAQCQLLITSEQGKLDLNSIYDFKEKKFITKGDIDGRKLLTAFAEPFKALLANISLSELIERYLKQRGKPLDDVSQLLEIKELAPLAAMLFPRSATQEKKDKNIAITDVFTVYTNTVQVQPLLLSESIQNIVGFSFEGSPEARKKDREQLSKEISFPVTWSQSWDKVMAPIVHKKFNDIPVFVRSVFDSNFEVKMFCVISYGTVGASTQKICAILEKDTADQHERYVIKKLYWL
jgi:hypothetical protein